MTGATKRNVLITLLIIAPILVLSGELFWQYALIDLFGKRSIDWCVASVMERELHPEVMSRLAAIWKMRKSSVGTDNVPQSIIYHISEIQEDLQHEFFTSQMIDELAQRTTEITSCRDYELAHWQVRITLEEEIEEASWQAINQILDDEQTDP